MEQLRSHLTNRQIEEYIQDGYGEDASPRSMAIESHIEECDSCRERLLQSSRQDVRVFLEIPEEEAGTEYRRTESCEDEETLRRFAAGILPDKDLQLTAHLTQCAYCAQAVKSYRGDIPADPPRRVPFIEKVRGILNRVSGFIPAKVLVPVCTALLVIGVSEPVWMPIYQLDRAEKQIIAAYSSHRPSEMRLTWSPYAQYSTTLGPDEDAMNDPKLAAAWNSVVQQGNTADPRWVQMRGRVELLRNRNEAVDALTQAKNAGLDDPATEIDLAAAYFQRDIQAAKSGTKEDAYQETIQLLEKVLRNPQATQEQRAVALFDLAITYEKLSHRGEAAKTWDEYLKIDSTSPWAEEARKHQSDDKQGIQPLKQQGYREPIFFCPIPPILTSVPA